jgi:DNA-binding response OmpR family regulator
MTELIGVPFLSALMVGEFETDRLLVYEVFRERGWRLFEACNRKKAMSYLEQHRVQVVVADCGVPGWNWKNILQDLRRLAPAPQLVVSSRTADDCLWSEVLNLGGYDVLARPLERDELERVVAGARRHFDPQPLRAIPRLMIAGAA